jgi:copper transport protein
VVDPSSAGRSSRRRLPRPWPPYACPAGRPVRRLLRLLAAPVGVAVLLVTTAVPAGAHAQLESTDPVQGSVVLVAPTQVVLHFGEPVEIDFGSLRVLGPDGRRVDSGGTHHPDGDSHAVAISLPAHLPRGTYVVAWRVISADSHPVHGAFVFSVGTASGAARASAEATALADQSGSTTVGVLYWLIRFAAFAGLLFLVGLAVAVMLAWRPGGDGRRVGRVLWASWWVLAVATVLGIAIQGVYAAALPLTDIVRPSLADGVVHTRFGRIELLRLVLLVAFVPVLLGIQGRLGRGPRRWAWVIPAGAVLGLGLLSTPGLAGHASKGGPAGARARPRRYPTWPRPPSGWAASPSSPRSFSGGRTRPTVPRTRPPSPARCRPAPSPRSSSSWRPGRSSRSGRWAASTPSSTPPTGGPWW